MKSEQPSGPLEKRLGERLASLRQARDWSLDELADRCGISRATLSRFERAETSPTAQHLGRLASVYGLTISRLMAEVELNPPRLVPLNDQVVWTDPESKFQRRIVSPPASGFQTEIVECILPAAQSITYETAPMAGMEQHLWVLQGLLYVTIEGLKYDLIPGDCLRFKLFERSTFESGPQEAARYILAVTRP